MIFQLVFDSNPVSEHTYAVSTLECCSGGSVLPVALSIIAPFKLERIGCWAQLRLEPEQP